MGLFMSLSTLRDLVSEEVLRFNVANPDMVRNNMVTTVTGLSTLYSLTVDYLAMGMEGGYGCNVYAVRTLDTVSFVGIMCRFQALHLATFPSLEQKRNSRRWFPCTHLLMLFQTTAATTTR